MIRVLLSLLLISEGALASTPVSSEGPQGTSSRTGRSDVLGWTETLALAMPNTGGVGQWLAVEAKVDTGAQTSSLHASELKIIKRNGRRFAQFKYQLESAKLLADLPLVKMARVKSSDGNSEERPFVEVTVCLGEKAESVLFSLNDRGEMRFPVLLGRSFLAGRYLVDSGAEFVMGPPLCKDLEKTLPSKM